jgi:hypothetical protein
MIALTRMRVPELGAHGIKSSTIPGNFIHNTAMSDTAVSSDD